MSKEATEAVRAMTPFLPRMIAEADPTPNMRPGVNAVNSVASELADRYRQRHNGEWYVDDTVDQLCEVLPLSPSTVKRCLALLHVLEIWVIREGQRGSVKRGTCRIPGTELVAVARRVGINLVALPRPDQLELGAVARPVNDQVNGNSSRCLPELVAVSTELVAAPRPSTSHKTTKDDDDARGDTKSAPAERSSSSGWSTKVHTWAHRAAKREAARRGHVGERTYIEAIKDNWRREVDDETGLCRYDELAALEEAGLTIEQAIARFFGEPVTAATTADHPPDCQCHGERVVPVVQDGRQVFEHCPGLKVPA